MKPGINGFDVSHHNGVVDFAKLSAQGHKFCFVKASESVTVPDSQFKRNWSEAPRNGLLVGAYHFFRADHDPAAQAKHFLDTIGTPRVGDLPCVIDLETLDGMRVSVIKQRALQFLDIVEKANGKIPILYTYKSFLEGLGDMSAFAKYPLWLAEYRGTMIRPANWKQPIQFWQYSDGTAEHSHLDLNVFNGDLQALRALAKIS